MLDMDTWIGADYRSGHSKALIKSFDNFGLKNPMIIKFTLLPKLAKASFYHEVARSNITNGEKAVKRFILDNFWGKKVVLVGKHLHYLDQRKNDYLREKKEFSSNSSSKVFQMVGYCGIYLIRFELFKVVR